MRIDRVDPGNEAASNRVNHGDWKLATDSKMATAGMAVFLCFSLRLEGL